MSNTTAVGVDWQHEEVEIGFSTTARRGIRGRSVGIGVGFAGEGVGVAGVAVRKESVGDDTDSMQSSGW